MRSGISGDNCNLGVYHTIKSVGEGQGTRKSCVGRLIMENMTINGTRGKM